MKRKQHSDVYLAMHNMLGQNDPHSFAVMKMIQDIYPAFERKIKDENDFMYKLVMSGYNPMDILEYPICAKCEGLSAWDGYGKNRGEIKHIARCMNSKCGHTTYHNMSSPFLFRDIIRQELKKKAPENVIGAIDYAIDKICESYVKIAYARLVEEMKISDALRSSKMGIQEPENDVPQEETKPKIEVNFGNLDDIDVDKLVKKEEEALENNV